MIRIMFLIGLLLPLRATAQGVVALPTPISPYVQEVLARIERIESDYLPTLSAVDQCTSARKNEIAGALSVVRQEVDAMTSLIAQSQDITDVTACQRYDLDLLERKMQLLLERMIEASEACELPTLRALGEMYRALARAHESVLRGGLDPEYADFQLRRPLFSDPANEEGQVCPFTSDYAPPSLAEIVRDDGAIVKQRMGCDSDVLSYVANQDIPQARKDEAAQMAGFIGAVEAIADDVGAQIVAFEEAFRGLFRVVRGEDEPPLDPARPPHLLIAGCRELVVEEDADGDGTPERNVFAVETWDDESLPRGLLLVSTADPFTVSPSSVPLLRRFITQAHMFGRSRPVSGEAPSNIFGFITWYEGAEHIKQAASSTERERALIEAMSRDALERMYGELTPLHDAVQSFGYVASFPPPGKERPRLIAYVRDLALFLRRSCVWGFCNETLDAVLKRSLNEHCYPYGSGCFREPGYVEKCYENSDRECPET